MSGPSKPLHLSTASRSYRSALGLFAVMSLVVPAKAQSPAPRSSKAAQSCEVKLKALEDFSVRFKGARSQTIRFTEEEVNSYLAQELSPQYQESLKNLQMTFDEGALRGVATINFDRLGTLSTKFMTKVLSAMLSGTHRLSVAGQLVSANGKAYFRLDQARFDDSSLPRPLVEEIITAVGKKQNPPFDPLKPSQLPYGIEKVDVHRGYLATYQ